MCLSSLTNVGGGNGYAAVFVLVVLTYWSTDNDFCPFLTGFTLLIQTAPAIRTHNLDVVNLTKLLCLVVDLQTQIKTIKA